MSKFIDVYSDILYKLENGENFSFVRYGDGEFGIIFKNELFTNHLLKRWGDSLIPFSDVLRKVVESKPKYYFGVQDLAYSLWSKDIDDMIEGIDSCVNSDIFHRRSGTNTISDFFEVLSKRNVVIVGPEYLKDIPLFKIYGHIITPEYHVWNEIDSIKYSIRSFINENADGNKLVFLYSCSIVTNILIDIFSAEDITQIDTGSLLDPYVGVNSRAYHVDVLGRLGIPDDKIRIPLIK
jgi:hypothetical protein